MEMCNDEGDKTVNIFSSCGAGRVCGEAASRRDHILFCALETLCGKYICAFLTRRHSNLRTFSCLVQSGESETLDMFFSFGTRTEAMV